MYDIIHRLDSNERKHYLLGEHITFVVKPKLLYVGELKQIESWKDELHFHDFVEIVFVTDGLGTLYINDEIHEIKKGDIIIYNANVKHQEISNTNLPLKMFFIAYSDVKLTQLPVNHLIPIDYPVIYKCNDFQEIFCHYFNLMINEISKKDKFFSEISQSTSRTLLMFLFRIINDTVDTVSLLSANSSFTKAMQYIECNYKEEFSLEDISKKFFINKYYLAHLFKKEKQISIKSFVLKRRLNEAASLLKLTNHSVSQISVYVGFNNLNYFCRIFKKIHNLTPMQYRKQHV